MTYDNQSYPNQVKGFSGPISSGVVFTPPLTAQAEAPNRAPQISVQIDILDKELSAHAAALETLYDRLSPVLSLSGPAGEGKPGNQANEPTCPVAARIQQQALYAVRATALIHDLLLRLEV